MDSRLRARRQAVTTARRRRQRALAVVGLIVLVLALAAGLLARSPWLAIDRVRVEGVEGQRVEQVRQRMRGALGASVLLTDTAAWAEDVTSLAWVEHATVHRRLPTTLEVDVSRREPVAVVRTLGGQWRVDAEQVVVGPGGGNGELVVIDGEDAVVPPPGRALRDDTLRQAVETVTGLPAELADRVSAVDASRPRALALRLESGPTVSLGSAERLQAKLDALALVLADLEARLDGDLTGIAEIDVRAPQNPTVRRVSGAAKDPGESDGSSG
jgi:cell division protein FtsQ